MQKIGLIVIGIVIVIAVAIFGTRGYTQSNQTDQAATSSKTTSPPAEESTTTSEDVEKNVVTYTSSGFSPISLSVEVGTTVVFENESSRSMWVASTPHPAHTDLSGFDAKTGSSKGESYSYTFTESGKFGFHNHLSPSNTGTIEVK